MSKLAQDVLQQLSKEEVDDDRESTVRLKNDTLKLVSKWPIAQSLRERVAIMIKIADETLKEAQQQDAKRSLHQGS